LVSSQTRTISSTISPLSPGRYALPIRALEHGEELAVRVAEAGSDLDLHVPRIRPAAGDPGRIDVGVDASEPYA
jgi:hypothetical protein